MKTEMNVAQYETYLKKWADGVFYELEFWNKWVETRGFRWPDDFTRRMDLKSPIKDDFKEILILLGMKDPKVLDIGAGPITCLGYMFNDKRLSIEACDPLATFYTKIFNKHNITVPVTTNFAMAEKLTEVYTRNSFDVAYCNNALDHSFDPLSAISEMIHVIKPGGAVILSHNENEAVHENYEGFHQWNFTEKNNDFVIWNKDFEINVTKQLSPDTKVIVERKGDNKTWIMVTILKQKDIIDHAIFPRHIINHGLFNYCTSLILDTKPVLF